MSPSQAPAAGPAPVVRIARPTDDIDRLLPFYVDGLNCTVLARFVDHAGFDGAIVGFANAPYHLEFTRERGATAPRAPSTEHLLVLYYPLRESHRLAVTRMKDAGFSAVASSNPYWDVAGVTFEDPDGYRVVLQQAAWTL